MTNSELTKLAKEILPEGKSSDYYQGLLDGWVKVALALRIMDTEVLVSQLDACIEALDKKLKRGQ